MPSPALPFSGNYENCLLVIFFTGILPDQRRDAFPLSTAGDSVCSYTTVSQNILHTLCISLRTAAPRSVHTLFSDCLAPPGSSLLSDRPLLLLFFAFSICFFIPLRSIKTIWNRRDLLRKLRRSKRQLASWRSLLFFIVAQVRKGGKVQI